MARQLDAAQAITHVGSWEWDMATGVVTWSDELYRIYGMSPQSQPITFDAFIASLVPSERERIRTEIAGAVERGGRFSYREQIVRPDGTIRVLDTVGEVVADDAGKPIGLIGTCRDVTDEEMLSRTRQRAERVRAGEREALELLASGAPLEDVLTVIVKMIEELTPWALASILLLDDGKLRHGAAPHLPVEYNRAIDGAQIGPKAGSCGTAAYRGEAVFVANIETDPLWIGYRHLVEPYGLRACWSSPIKSAEGGVVGTFALYFREPVEQTALPRDLVARAAHVAGIAIERRQLDDQLRALPERLEAVREEERTSIAREIHDELGQALTALKLDIAWIARRTKTGGDEVARKLDEMAHSTDDIITTVRRISSELRPGILDSVGLRAALEWQAEDFTRRTGIPCEVRSDVGELQLERSLSTAVFRIFQEALTNVARHANATRVEVYLRLERGMLKLDISDDGVGVPEIAPRNSSLGLLGMRERARRCGGECTIRRRSPRGTIVSVSVPLRFPKAHDHDHELGTG
ncbi:MAG: GAF domain-containing protein [Kofleriaceae bacterium]|nr:GAF domain-containing protein [Kofleriaceae bacterium]